MGPGSLFIFIMLANCGINIIYPGTGSSRGQQPSLHNKSVPYKKPAASVPATTAHRGSISGSSEPGRGSISGPGPASCAECGLVFDNASFLHLHRVLMHSRRRRGGGGEEVR